MKKLLVVIGVIFVLYIIGSVAEKVKTTNTITITDMRKKDPQKLSKTKHSRILYGKKLREYFLDQSLNIKVFVYGKYKNKIKLTFILFTDVWIHKFQKGDFLNEMANIGFTKIILDNDRKYNGLYWTWNFKPKEYGYIYR